MSKRPENRVLSEICRQVKNRKKITQEQIDLLSKLLGSRFDNALQVVKQKKVTLYTFNPSKRRVWIVAGKRQDYEILPKAEFCTCDDYYFRVIGGKTTLCYHLIAQKLAEALEKYNLIQEGDEKYSHLMKKQNDSSLD
jgi:predicted nucleic acid-binding Zn finger protein